MHEHYSFSPIAAFTCSPARSSLSSSNTFLVFPVLPRTVRGASIFGSVLFTSLLQLSISTDGIDQSPSQLAYITALATQYLNGRQIFDY